MEDFLALESAERHRAIPSSGCGERVLRVLWKGPQRSAGAGAALAAIGACRGLIHWRGIGKVIRGKTFPASRPRPYDRTGGQRQGCLLRSPKIGPPDYP